MAGSPRTIGKRITNQQPTTGQERTQGIAPFLFVSEAVRKGKRATNTKSQATKPRKQDKEQESSQAGQEDKREDKRGKQKEGTKERFCRESQQAIKPPNHSRTQKPHNPRKALNLYKYTSAPQNPLKTPLKSEIRHISRLMQESNRSRGDERQEERDGTHHERTTKALHTAPSAPSGHAKRQAADHLRACIPSCISKIY